MDRQFLEFWGNFLLSAAKGQRQLDDMSRWMAQGMKGFQDMNAMFLKFYGLEKEDKRESEMWKTAQTAFKDSYKSYMDAMGVVSKSDHTKLKQQFEALQEKVALQDATIGKLRKELSDCRLSQGDTLRGFEELIRVQSDQFRELTDSFGRFFSSSTDDENNKKET